MTGLLGCAHATPGRSAGPSPAASAAATGDSSHAPAASTTPPGSSTREPPASPPGSPPGTLTIVIPQVGKATYRMSSVACRAGRADATLVGGGTATLSRSDELAVSIPGLRERRLHATVTAHPDTTQTSASGVAPDGAAVSASYPCIRKA